jgi:Flp pilus assembly protein TadG
MRSILSVFRNPLRHSVRMLGDHEGGSAVLLALSLSGIIGFAGLGTEVASWYLTKRSMQSAADSAATTAAASLARNTSATQDQLLIDARSIAATFNFVDGTASTSVTMNQPPTTTTGLDSSQCRSPLTGYQCYVEVVITQPQTPLLSALFMSSGPTITSRAVALANTKVGDQGCVLALNGASVIDIQLNGGINLNFTGCAFYDNSPLQSAALTMSNNASLSALAGYIVGTANQTTGITTTDGLFTGINPINDPYADVPLPAPHAACDDSSRNNNKNLNMTLSATSDGTYVFCKDVSMDANGGNPVLTLNPGIYILACGANLNMTSGTIQASGGVTLVLERACPSGNAASNPGTTSITGNANINITAPASGPTSGLAFFQERYTCTASVTNCTNTLGGGGNLNITGAAYFPNNPVNYAGGTATGGASQCTQLIANTITFTGGATLQQNCQQAGTRQIGGTAGTLVM